MSLYDDIVAKREKVSLVGLGYVGLPIAIAFAKKIDVLGFDICETKVQQYKNGFDPTKEVGDEAVRNTTMEFSCDEARLKECKFHIVAVPTPVKADKTPDLTPIIKASETVGRNLVKGAYVVFESTVYPGVTEDVCVPILEKESGLRSGEDFKVGYSPERINPGDKVHRLETIIKVVSGMDEESLDTIAKVYELVVDAGVYKASSIKVAEAAKVIENSQRDVNIAFVNELSIIFNQMGIDTLEVLAAAATKWNFLNFKPGLVGGHCIGVDPYYLTYKAAELGYHSQVILSGRRINDGMGKFVVENLVKKLISADIPVKRARVAIFGFTFKEDCPDTRNTRVIDMVKELNEYGIEPYIIDPVADKEEAKHEYGLEFDDLSKMVNLDAIIIAVSHEQFKDITKQQFDRLYAHNSRKIIFDIKGSLDKSEFEKDYIYWRL
ncbi:nucleotide sugar dehydrogenase [Francisella tularensis subsp. novicida]|uniref:Nucleotide sugar dehydrogenase n=2 Tax=Francisella tularensis TaxID=263 RepID=A0A6I4RUP5_FRATU|nr:nucleotide sugar dehydrogenase [Francisella tularensis]ABK90294.1 UDP-glucose/GDP-mannose dehydrogenase family protein [Francisella tularensis subsp. novicida U112]AJI60421.1 nucleotide sugar dehydrogenase family protein [Francisella tularensis subsp. novicida U112]EDX20067.1 UDP-glucose/GDP-mannose dehydrogenase [Francisella tularensis subsp. novicida FTE]MBK2035892.1 nucleotide sugar dehydrogenase [Francisella tularensis subsp. novicida]MBK2116661.1 nucleotide sugar dehydrogenase [Francis